MVGVQPVRHRGHVGGGIPRLDQAAFDFQSLDVQREPRDLGLLVEECRVRLDGSRQHARKVGLDGRRTGRTKLLGETARGGILQERKHQQRDERDRRQNDEKLTP